MAKPTTGSYVADGVIVRAGSNTGLALAYCSNPKFDDYQAAANAQLFAAGPDMATALRECIKSLDYAAMVLEVPDKSSFRASISDARAALIKAGFTNE
jgi:hypothetical protein